MFKNRKVEIKVVNTKNAQTESLDDISFEAKAAIYSVMAHNAIHTIGKVMIAYVAVDLIRKVVIEKAKN